VFFCCHPPGDHGPDIYREDSEIGSLCQQHVDDEMRREENETNDDDAKDASCRRGANATIHHALRLMYRTLELPVMLAAAAALRYSTNPPGIGGDGDVRSVTARSNVRSFVRCTNYLIIVGAQSCHILLSFYRASAWPVMPYRGNS